MCQTVLGNEDGKMRGRDYVFAPGKLTTFEEVEIKQLIAQLVLLVLP